MPWEGVAVSADYEILGIHQDQRDEWLRARMSGVGASETAAILGLSPWASALSVFADKCGVGEPVGDSEHLYWGRRLEHVIAEELGKEIGAECQPSGALLRSTRWPFMLCTLDAVVGQKGNTHPAELKTSTNEGAWRNGIPKHYWVQVQHQLAVTGKDLGFIGCLLGGRGFKFRWAAVQRDEDFIQKMVADLATFWDCVQRKEQPLADGSAASRKALAALFPTDNGETICLPAESVDLDDELAAAEAEAKAATARVEEAKNRIRQWIGEASYGEVPGGARYSLKANKNGVRTLRRHGGGQHG